MKAGYWNFFQIYRTSFYYYSNAINYLLNCNTWLIIRIEIEKKKSIVIGQMIQLGFHVHQVDSIKFCWSRFFFLSWLFDLNFILLNQVFIIGSLNLQKIKYVPCWFWMFARESLAIGALSDISSISGLLWNSWCVHSESVLSFHLGKKNLIPWQRPSNSEVNIGSFFPRPCGVIT